MGAFSHDPTPRWLKDLVAEMTDGFRKKIKIGTAKGYVDDTLLYMGRYGWYVINDGESIGMAVSIKQEKVGQLTAEQKKWVAKTLEDAVRNLKLEEA